MARNDPPDDFYDSPSSERQRDESANHLDGWDGAFWNLDFDEDEGLEEEFGYPEKSPGW